MLPAELSELLSCSMASRNGAVLGETEGEVAGPDALLADEQWESAGDEASVLGGEGSVDAILRGDMME